MSEYDRDVAHIVYASDGRFAEILGVSLVSLLENSRDMEEIFVYILDSGILADDRERIERVCKEYGRRAPRWIAARNIEDELMMKVAVDRGSLSQYERLFISRGILNGLHRVLYLDCDILVRQSIRELWNLDLQGKTVAALMDAFSREYRRNIGLEPDDTMFNSGVMLIDLDKWKKDSVEERLMAFIKGKNGQVQQGDQGALNAILSHDVFCFEPRMNSVTIYYDFSYDELLLYRKPPAFYTKEQIKEAVDNPSIVHFTTSFASRRPWVEGCRHRYVGEWLRYEGMSPWSSEPLWTYVNPNGLRGAYIRSSRYMPRKLMMALSGWLQAYGRPWMVRMRSRRLWMQRGNPMTENRSVPEGRYIDGQEDKGTCCDISPLEKRY